MSDLCFDDWDFDRLICPHCGENYDMSEGHTCTMWLCHICGNEIKRYEAPPRCDNCGGYGWLEGDDDD